METLIALVGVLLALPGAILAALQIAALLRKERDRKD